jgi:hypothetical protein
VIIGPAIGVGSGARVADSPAVAAACELVIADDPADWARLGFAPDAAGVVALGPLAIRLAGSGAGEGIVALVLDGEGGGDADGLPLRVGATSRSSAPSHPNGAVAIDHVVVLTGSRDRTAVALVRAGGDERRRGGPPELPARMAFVRFGPLVVEVAEPGAAPPRPDPPAGPARFWGVTVTTTDIDTAAALAGRPPRAAVQPGRRILTVPREAGLSTALALITPRPSPPGSAARG